MQSLVLWYSFSSSVLIAFCSAGPSTPPDELQVSALDSNTVLVSWHPPVESNGIIVEYRILYGGNSSLPDHQWSSLSCHGASVLHATACFCSFVSLYVVCVSLLLFHFILCLFLFFCFSLCSVSVLLFHSSVCFCSSVSLYVVSVPVLLFLCIVFLFFCFTLCSVCLFFLFHSIVCFSSSVSLHHECFCSLVMLIDVRASVHCSTCQLCLRSPQAQHACFCELPIEPWVTAFLCSLVCQYHSHFASPNMFC